METNFQTSFIPKKPILSQQDAGHSHHVGASLIMIIASFIFILSIAGAILTFAGKAILLSSQAQLKVDLADNEKRFNVPLITLLTRANAKIDLANQLLKNHITVSEVFKIISKLTIDGVRFSNFEFLAADNAGKNGKAYKINMKGIANSFNSVAFQSDVFGFSQRYGTNKAIKNPVLSDLSVDLNGNVVFNFSAEVAQPDISYENVLKNNE